MKAEKIDRLNRTYINFSFFLLGLVNVTAGQTKIPVAVQLFVNAFFCIYIGSWFGLQIDLKRQIKKEGDDDKRKNKEDDDEEQEQMTMKDAAMFPIYGSMVLLSLYLVFKVIDKKFLTYLFAIYFSICGIFCAMSMLEYYLIDYFPGYNHSVIINKKFNINLGFTSTVLPFKFTTMDIITFILAAPITGYYAFTRHWLLNNLFGILFSVIGIQSLNLPSFKIAFVLLWGLFFYDIFWVYGTDVMLTVAKSVDAPIKLMFPSNLGTTPIKFSMLGLGDIVIPGIFVALCVRYDINRVLEKSTKKLVLKDIIAIRTPYFNWCMIGYACGIIITFAVLMLSGHAQPALLFLVPCCCLSVVIVAFFEGDFWHMIAYDESWEDKEDEKIK